MLRILNLLQITGLTRVLPPQPSVSAAITADPHWRQTAESEAGSAQEWCRQRGLTLGPGPRTAGNRPGSRPHPGARLRPATTDDRGPRPGRRRQINPVGTPAADRRLQAEAIPNGGSRLPMVTIGGAGRMPHPPGRGGRQAESDGLTERAPIPPCRVCSEADDFRGFPGSGHMTFAPSGARSGRHTCGYCGSSGPVRVQGR
jgi:hypothetical protein